MYIQNAQVLQDDQFIAADLLIEGGLIQKIIPTKKPHSVSDGFSGVVDFAGATLSDCHVIDAAGLRVLPGFIDIHTHGGNGIDFNHATIAEIKQTAQFFASCGVTGFLPTVLTDSPDVMERQLAAVTDTAVMAECPQILGAHLEGPFLNVLYKGAQPEQFLSPCDIDLFDRLQQAARGNIKLITLAPELTGAIELITKLTAEGVRVSMGHSASSYEQAMAAIEAGAASCTHTMNGMKLLHMHDPALLTAVLESDIYAEMICDGFHLHPPIVRLLLKSKGLNRMIAVTDSIMAAGLPDGKYVLGANKVLVQNGDAKTIETGSRAGSTLTMDKAVRNILQFTALPLEQVSRLVSENPARFLGIFDKTGSIEEGKQADLTLLDSQNNVRLTIIQGEKI